MIRSFNLSKATAWHKQYQSSLIIADNTFHQLQFLFLSPIQLLSMVIEYEEKRTLHLLVHYTSLLQDYSTFSTILQHVFSMIRKLYSLLFDTIHTKDRLF